MPNWQKLILCILIGVMSFSIFHLAHQNKEFRIENYSYVPPEHQAEYNAIQASLPISETLTKFSPSYFYGGSEDENLDQIQSPIPMKDRVFNVTGIQCVWASIEAIGRWAEESKLMNPPLTSRPECKSFSSPTLAAQVLNKLGVKFEQTHKDKAAGIQLIKKAMSEGRGCLWGVPGHAMVLLHYEEEKNVVKWFDNCDQRLAVQTTTIDKFYERWDSWILVIYADNDIVSSKTNRNGWAWKIPIFDMNNDQQKFNPDYVPHPNELFSIPIPKP